jgi:hypothetical protein
METAMRGNSRCARVLVLVAAVALSGAPPVNAAVGPGSPDLGLPQVAPAPTPAPAIRGLAPGSPSQSAGPDRGLLSAALAAAMAADALAALAKDSTTGGIVPLQSSAGTATLLDEVFNVDILKTKPDLGRADIPSLLAWLNAVDSVSSIYLLAGIGITDLAAAAQDPKVSAQADRNTVLYAAEIGRSIDATLVLSGATAAAIAGAIGEIGATDAGRSALDQIRAGIAGTLTQTVITLATPGVDAAWRQARVTALIAVAPQVAKLLLEDQCATIRTAADRAGRQLTDASVIQGLQNFDAALMCG